MQARAKQRQEECNETAAGCMFVLLLEPVVVGTCPAGHLFALL